MILHSRHFSYHIIFGKLPNRYFLEMSSSRSSRFNFMEHKSVWNRVIFSFTYEKLKWPRAEIDQFWLFLQKYVNSPNKNSEADKKRIQMGAKLLSKWSESIPDEWKDIDFLCSKVKELNCQHYIDARAICEFRDVLMMFVDFNQGRKMKKCEKLRTFQENLPIYQYQRNILETIESYSVILIAGDTGCGKSTQVPQYLLKAGYENICCTQPRRLACISLRNRLAFETVDEYGSEIGYQIRFEKHKTKHTKMLFMTEGLLLRQMIEDPSLGTYNVIILDEIHERHLSCDFLLGAIKCLLNRRKDNLKVILMSATVNCELFSQYFGNCPVVKVPGRLFPIKVEYFPVEKFALLKTTAKVNPEPFLKLLRHIDSTYSETERGDVLVFLSGFLEIETVGEVLKNYADQTGKWIVLYLHSSLAIAEQDKVFDIAPAGVRKCILSTNIAETSLTIDGVRFVIDSGKVKEMYYDSKIRMQKLQEIWVSKASAEQRKGRSGRTGPGVCFRLYSPKEFDAFLDFSTAEIKRVSLESLLLNMISMGLNDVRQFPFLEPPDLTAIESTIKCLIDYDTIDEKERITLMGRILSKLPVDIAIGKMLIIAIGHQLVDFFLSAAACLSVHALFSSRSLNDLEAVEERKRLSSFEGDLFSHINFYSQWLMYRAQGQNTRSWCRRLGLEEQRFFEVTKLRNQFKGIVTDTGLLQKNPPEESLLNKSERKIKHGERKMYQKMKREHDQQKHKKRKVLNMHESQYREEEAEENDPEVNMKDMEFKLIFDETHLREIENRHRLNADEMQVAKLIVCMSFFPQLAVADLDNSYRTDSDQMFHTKEKPFVVLHPSSVFYNQPELLRPSDVEYSPLGMLSSKHTLLGYISLIETTKTYICNCYPISAIHALLLCAHEIDTNEDMSRLVCDNWIELQCASWEESQDVLLKALQLRRSWARLLENLFNDLSEINNERDSEAIEGNCEPKSKGLNFVEEAVALKHQMKVYLNSQPKYAMKRLLPADLKQLHSRKPLNIEEMSQFQHRPLCWLASESIVGTVNSKKGGIRISHLNYNCLQLNQTDEMTRASRKYFDCSICQQRMHLSVIEWARHQELCRKKEREKEQALASQSKPSSSSGGGSGNRYFCRHCDREFAFSKIEILRHRQKHSSSSS